MTDPDSPDLHEEQLLADRFGIPSIEDPLHYPFVEKGIHPLPYAFVREKGALPLEEKEGKLLIAISQPRNLDVLEEIRHLTGKEVEELFCPHPRLKEAIEKCYCRKEAFHYIEGLKRESLAPAPKIEGEEGRDILERRAHSPAVRLLNTVIAEAVQQRASDIHFEPSEGAISIRYRIDGVLQMRHQPPLALHRQLLTRIKVIGGMDSSEYRLPQDGRVKLRIGERRIDFRISTIPTIHGERLVLRILDKDPAIRDLATLDMPPSLLRRFRSYLLKNQGMILVTGPTGSGKTTTLYGAIDSLNPRESNVMTIEDPVEYKLTGISQTGVNPKIGLTFARGLRHILRQDPDIIMIGEIRDRETAEIAVQSSLTGHLVLSTLHTSDAPSALTRLIDMGIESYLLTSSLLAVLSQRLLRKICNACKAPYKPTERELRTLQIDRQELEEGYLYKGKGCPSCFASGYWGRCGVYELMPLSRTIQNQLAHSADVTRLQEIARRQGIRSLRQEGILLAKKGITSTEEVLRAIQI